MEYDLRERIEELQKCRAEITAIQSRIKNEKEDFLEYVASERKALEETIARERIALETTLEARKENKKRELAEKLKPMDEECARLHDRVNYLGHNVVSIRLGDLIEDLANLLEINISDIMVNIYCNTIFGEERTIEEIAKSINQRTIKEDNDIWRLKLYSNKEEHSFCYKMLFKADLNSKQKDSKTLLEHCTITPWTIYTCLKVDEDYDDLLINIPLSYLTIDSDPFWYPADLMTQAVINCAEKSQEKEASKGNVKKRSRKLSDETNK